MEAIIQGFDIVSVTNNVFYVALIMIAFDVVTGLLVGAKERKLNSSISFEGAVRKFALIVALFFVTFIDVYFQTKGLLTSMGLGMIVLYEGLSIIENFELLGVKMKWLHKYFDENKKPKEGEKYDKNIS